MTELVLNNVIGMVPSIIVGMAAAYLTAQKTLAGHSARLNQLEEVVRGMDQRERVDADRLTRLEAKLDVILMSIERKPMFPAGE